MAAPAATADRARWIVMGRIESPYGIKGWLNIVPYSASPTALLDYREWRIGNVGDGDPETAPAAWRAVDVLEARAQGDHLVAHLAGCEDREQAERLKKWEIAVPRSWLPALAENEFYWADLVGLDVVNAQGEKLGVVSGLFSNGVQDVLRVADGTPGAARERLIPYVAQYVQGVDLAARVIRVDWQRDW
jgi:16S rRNA processing protein RimM